MIPIDRATIERLAREFELAYKLVCGVCGGSLPNPDCGHKANGVPNCCLPQTDNEVAATLLALRDALDAVREKAPEGMKHCTILFKECENGHGWLTATNWVPFDCPTCALDAAREKALEEAAQAADAVERDYDEADAAFIANGAGYAAAAIRALKTKE